MSLIFPAAMLLQRAIENGETQAKPEAWRQFQVTQAGTTYHRKCLREIDDAVSEADKWLEAEYATICRTTAAVEKMAGALVLLARRDRQLVRPASELTGASPWFESLLPRNAVSFVMDNHLTRRQVEGELPAVNVEPGAMGFHTLVLSVETNSGGTTFASLLLLGMQGAAVSGVGCSTLGGVSSLVDSLDPRQILSHVTGMASLVESQPTLRVTTRSGWQAAVDSFISSGPREERIQNLLLWIEQLPDYIAELAQRSFTRHNR